MSYGFLDIAGGAGVRAAQAEMGSEHLWQDFKGDRAFDRFRPSETSFIAQRDSFYMATVSESGWPYVQHRGGPPGFLKVLDETTFGFADYRGNRQYISLGNLARDDRVSLILMDYPNRARLKIFAHMETVSLADDPALAERLSMPGYKGQPERSFRLRLAAFDWNCPQHITRRFTQSEISAAIAPLHEKLETLETENAALRANLARYVKQNGVDDGTTMDAASSGE